MSPSKPILRSRQLLGKYRLERKLADGGFAAVYKAMDTIEGIHVALKIPHDHLVSVDVLENFRREVRMTAALEHVNILPLKNASLIDNHFVIVSPLGQESLADRLQRRIALRTALDFGEQLIEAAAYAHRHRIIHCDIKPDNIILFSGNRVRLADFGVAKVAQKTVKASGAGTIGYMAPEQALGRPSLRSDVFSLGLVLYRMLSGTLPEWPFPWPGPGHSRLKQRLHPDLMDVLRKALEVNSRKRYRDADQMLRAYRPAARKTLALQKRRRRSE